MHYVGKYFKFLARKFIFKFWQDIQIMSYIFGAKIQKCSHFVLNFEIEISWT